MYLRSILRTLPSKKENHFKCTFRVVSNGNQVFQVIFSKQIKNQKQNNPNLQGIKRNLYTTEVISFPTDLTNVCWQHITYFSLIP